MGDETTEVADTTPQVDMPDSAVSFQEHCQGVIGAITKRIIEEMYFRNILAVAIVLTFCYMEIAAEGVSETFGMITALVVGMYFPSGDKAKA